MLADERQGRSSNARAASLIAPRAREASVQISLQFDRSRTVDSAARSMNQSRRRAACSVEAPQARCRDCSAPPPSRAAANRAGSLYRRPDRASQVRNQLCARGCVPPPRSVIQVRTGLAAGGNEIRTVGPIKSAQPQSSSPAGPPDLLSAGISPGHKVPVVASPKFDKGIKALVDTFTV